MIDQSAIKGEDGTGFEKRGSKGPFQCGNCTYMEGNHCTQKDMKAKSKQPKTHNGFPMVDAEDCCEYVNRPVRMTAR